MSAQCGSRYRVSGSGLCTRSEDLGVKAAPYVRGRGWAGAAGCGAKAYLDVYAADSRKVSMWERAVKRRKSGQKDQKMLSSASALAVAPEHAAHFGNVRRVGAISPVNSTQMPRHKRIKRTPHPSSPAVNFETCF